MALAELAIVTHTRGRLSVVEVAGDLDLAGATRLMVTLLRSAETGARVVVCDLSRLLAPLDTSLLMIFPTVQRRSGPWPRSSIHLAAAGPELGRRLHRLGMSRFVSMHASLDAALRAATADAQAADGDELLLWPAPESSGSARAAVARLWPSGAGDPSARDDGLLVADELTANAIRHVNEPFSVALRISPTRFLVAVTDTSRREPIVRPFDATAVDGRGLQLVSKLSTDWGVRLIHEQGKTVWAALRREASKVDSGSGPRGR